MNPETKDWTWVLQRPCPECGLDTGSFAREDIPEMILANAVAWQDALTGSAGPAARPAPGTWSPVEYACQATAANRFAEVDGGLWQRKGRRSDGVCFTVETFGPHLVQKRCTTFTT